MTCKVFGGTLSLTQSINQSVMEVDMPNCCLPRECIMLMHTVCGVVQNVSGFLMLNFCI